MVQQLRAFLKKLVRTSAAAAMLLFLVNLNTDAYAQAQVWTYDFGNETGTFSSGDVTNPDLLPSTQTGGGDTRLRIGGGNEIILSETGNEIGTFSRMKLNAAPTRGRNIFEINSIDATELAYLRATIKITAEGENNLEIFLGNDDSAGNTLSLSYVVAGIRFSSKKMTHYL